MRLTKLNRVPLNKCL